jgi:hypothetical protein
MAQAAASVRVSGGFPTSVQPSETSPQPLGGLRALPPAPFRPVPLRSGSPRWLDTRHQIWIHARRARERELTLSALASSDDPALCKRLRRIEACCVAPLFCLRSNATVGVAAGLCRDRMCPTCQSIRARDVIARVRDAAARMNAPRFLTITQVHREEPLAASLDRLYASFRELRRRPEWKAHVTGGVAVAEVTRNRKAGTWHAHFHVLIDGAYFPHPLLKKLWAAVSPGSSIVHIEACHNRDAAARYIAAYVAKPAELESLPPDSICEFALAMHGRRLLVAFGNAYKSGGSDDECCEKVEVVAPLASAPVVLRRLARGDALSDRLRVLLAGLGGLGRAAVGLGRTHGSEQRDRLGPGEHAELAALLRRVADERSGARALPAAPPRPVEIQARLWCPPDAAACPRPGAADAPAARRRRPPQAAPHAYGPAVAPAAG